MKTICPNCKNKIDFDVDSEMMQCPQCGVKLRKKPLLQEVDLNKLIEVPTAGVQADIGVADNDNDVEECENTAKSEGDMIDCPVCGRQISGKFGFCPYCGGAVRNRCANCGYEMADGDRYCPQCGHSIKKHNGKRVTRVKCASKSDKMQNKHMNQILKSAIYLVLSILLFAFAFCPIYAQMSRYIYNGYANGYAINELSGIDFIDIMFATAKHYDQEDDAAKIEKLEKEISKLKEEFDKESVNCMVSLNGEIKYNTKAKDLSHKIAVKDIKKYVMVDGCLSDAQEGQYIVIGLLSLVYIVLSALTLVLGAVALTLNIISLKTGKVFGKFASCNYIYIMPMFLFVSIAITFSLICSSSLVAFVAPLAATFKARLAFESLAMILVIAGIVVDSLNKKEKMAKGIFKVGALVLSLVAVVCCFAPCFKGIATYQNDDGDDCVIRAQASLGVLNDIDISNEKQNYLDKYEDSTDSTYKRQIQNAISRQIGGSNNVGDVAAYAIWSEYKVKDAGKVSMGFYFAILTIIMLGISACFACDDKQSSTSLRRLFLVLAIIFVIATITVSAVTAGLVNDILEGFDLEDVYVLKLSGGAFGTLVCGVLLITLDVIAKKLQIKRKKA